MKKVAKISFILLMLMFTIFITTGCNKKELASLTGEWIDCGNDLVSASKKTGFRFPLVLSNYRVQATNDIIEVAYPLDEFREVKVRKSLKEIERPKLNIENSEYMFEEKVVFNKTTVVNFLRDEMIVYTMDFNTKTGYYSVVCEQGMTFQEAKGVFKVIVQVENPELLRK